VAQNALQQLSDCFRNAPRAGQFLSVSRPAARKLVGEDTDWSAKTPTLSAKTPTLSAKTPTLSAKTPTLSA
jgi:hypothetical protein